MAVTDAYATAAQYRAVIEMTDTSQDSELGDDLTAVSRYIDRKLNQFFTIDESAAARVFVGAGGRTLYLRLDDDLNPGIGDTDGLTIKVDTDDDGSFADETAWAATDYELRPLNAGDGPEPRPYTQIHVPSWSSKGGWPVRSRIEITAKWGWPAVPKAIERATLHLTAILRLESGRATNRINELGTELLDASPQAQSIIDKLLRAYPGAMTF